MEEMTGQAAEFRVQVAKMALMASRPQSIYLVSNVQLASLEPQVRAPVAPEQLWEYYKTTRSEFDVSLVPVRVDDFLKEVKPPTEQQLQDFFKAHKDNASVARTRRGEETRTEPTLGVGVFIRGLGLRGWSRPANGRCRLASSAVCTAVVVRRSVTTLQ